MEHVCSSRQDEYLFIDPNIDNMIIHDHVLNSSHEQEPPLFLDFPSPFFDAISTTPIHTNNHTNPHHITSQTKPVSIEASPSEPKRVKKRSGAKKDRHSKIHTAQGLRDRRMRLSLNIAQKFFNLQDLLGFDKASNTIEWLFCKSNKAIKEVAKNFSTQHTNQSMSVENSREEEEIKNTESRMKRMSNNSSVRETRDQARARARDRTRERLMMKKEDEKSKLVFAGNPNEEISKLGLGYLPNPNNQNAGELGLISSPTELIIPQEASSSMNNLNSFVNYSAGSVVDTLINHNPPAGWLNSWNGFLPVEWDIGDSECYNYGIVPTTVSLTGDMYEQNPSLFMMSSTTNILHQNQGK